MDNLIVVVDNIKDWRPYFPSDQIVPVQRYLFDRGFQENQNLRVINLCNKNGYLKHGYYCSMLAEARNHKVIPKLKTLNDLSKKTIYLQDLVDFHEIIDKLGKKLEKAGKTGPIEFKTYFSRTQEKEFEELGRKVFEYYPCPILEVSLICKDSQWRVNSVEQLGMRDLKEGEEDFFAASLDKYSAKIWRLPKNRKLYQYDMAILLDPDEPQAPSDQGALKKIKSACERNGMYCETITTKDVSRLSEFDALFIRKTTSIQNSTYRMAKIAESEGIAVIDDPGSILKCTNKIYISNLLDRIGVPSIPGDFVSDAKDETVDRLAQEFGLPLVVKIPDGSFSVGVKKAADKDEAKKVIGDFLKKSDLVLVQKFLFTEYDWRVGVLDKKALFACQYFMSENHWQIYNHDKDKESEEFSGNFKTHRVEDVPERVLKVAVKAASKIGNGLYGVDLKEDKEGNVYVVEINDNPNIDSGVEDLALGDELYDRVVQWFIKEIKIKKAL